MSDYHIGVDEIGTETQMLEGWGYFLLPTSAVQRFEEAAKALQLQANIPEYHSKKFKKHQSQSYKDFLFLIAEYILDNEGAFARCAFLNQAWKDLYLPHNETIVDLALSMVEPTDSTVRKALVSLVPPLFDLLPVLKSHGASKTIAVEIDSDDVRDKIAKTTVVREGVTVSGPSFLGHIYNGYRNRIEPTSPRMEQGAISVLPGKRSPLVQAADVIANFSMAAIYVALGDISTTRIAKARILNETVGIASETAIIRDNVEMCGKDLKLLTDGKFNFHLQTV